MPQAATKSVVLPGSHRAPVLDSLKSRRHVRARAGGAAANVESFVDFDLRQDAVHEGTLNMPHTGRRTTLDPVHVPMAELADVRHL